MAASEAKDHAVAVAVALLGAALFQLIGFPSASLTGSATAISIACLLGLRVNVIVWLRNVTFVLLGINIGTGVTPETLATAAQWPISIAILLVSLIVGLVMARWGLERWFGLDPRTASLASAPGHLSYVLSLSLDTKSDTSRIAVIQSVRVMIITLGVPVLVSAVFGAVGASLLPTMVMAPLAIAILVLATLMLGYGFTKIKLPAAYLLAGMAVSAMGHALSLTPGRLPDILNHAAFLMMGVVIGSRFSGQTWATLRTSLAAGLWVTGINLVTTSIAILLVMAILGLPPAVLIVAFSPGGVEAMAAIAVMLGLDPAFVAAHHVSRLLILTALIPLMMPRRA